MPGSTGYYVKEHQIYIYIYIYIYICVCVLFLYSITDNLFNTNIHKFCMLQNLCIFVLNKIGRAHV